MQNNLKQKSYHASIIVLFGLLLFCSACSEKEELLSEISTPMSCTYQGKLELDSDTIENLKHYERL